MIQIRLILFAVIALCLNIVTGFLASRPSQRRPLCTSNEAQFDFSSREGWDDFYTKFQNHRDGDEIGTTTTSTTQSSPQHEFEWHSSVPNSYIVDEVPPHASSCLVIGCGNSALPRQLYDSRLPCSDTGRDATAPLHVTCFDYSPPCLDYLQSVHGDQCPNMSFVQGDATNLIEAFDRQHRTREDPSVFDPSPTGMFDVIADKGLLDALMCGEGFDLDVERLLCGASHLLRDGGTYILVSYKLSTATKELLQEGVKGSSLVWKFDHPEKSTGSVSFSVAVRLPRLWNIDNNE